MALELRNGNFITKLFEFKQDMRDAWLRGPTEMPLRYWESYNQARIAADGRILVHRVTPKQALPLSIAESFCNKLSLMYWSHSAQLKYDDGSSGCSKAPGAAVWKEWLRCNTTCNATPSLDLSLYFAQPLKMEQTAPTTIPELLVLHQKLCDLAEQALLTQQNAQDRLRIKVYKILPLCRAIMVVLDQENSRNEKEDLTRSAYTRQNLLLVRTGCDEGLSAPIDLTKLTTHARPRGRSDIPFPSAVGKDAHEVVAVRVPLPVAVSYLWELQQREQRADPEFYAYLAENKEVIPLDGIDVAEYADWDRRSIGRRI